MEEIQFSKLELTNYQTRLEEYYENANGNIIGKFKSKSKSKSRGKVKGNTNWFSISNENGLQEFTNIDGSTFSVDEIRLPIFVDVKEWANKINQFLDKTEVTNKLNLVNSNLLEKTSTPVTKNSRYIFKVTSVSPALFTTKITDIRSIIVSNIFTCTFPLNTLTTARSLHPESIWFYWKFDDFSVRGSWWH